MSGPAWVSVPPLASPLSSRGTWGTQHRHPGEKEPCLRHWRHHHHDSHTAERMSCTLALTHLQASTHTHTHTQTLLQTLTHSHTHATTHTTTHSNTHQHTQGWNKSTLYTWDFGDGTVVSGTGLKENSVMTHQYSTSNIFTVHVKASNPGGYSDVTVEVFIGGTYCAAQSEDP